MTIALTPDSTARATRIAEAFDSAIVRVQAATAELAALGPVGALFAPLGESLTWLCALDGLLRDAGGAGYEQARDAHGDGRAIRGVRYVRNQAIHGVEVVAIVEFHGGAVPGLMVLGATALGQPPTYRWRPRVELPPLSQPRPAQEAAYDAHLSGREIIAVLGSAFGYMRSEAGL
jgi:hypothetical protein